MNKDENKWISVGSIQNFVNDKSQKAVDPYFDWFISSIVANIDNFNFSQYTKANIVAFVYLLLNTQFQSQVKKIRNFLDIPVNGFENEEMFNKWRNSLYQAMIDYKNKRKIPLKQNLILTFIEKQAIKMSAGRMTMTTILNNLEDVFILIFMRLLKIGKDRNEELWGSLFYHLIITFNPKALLYGSQKFDRENDISLSTDDFGSTNLIVPLSLNSTINSIITIIEKNKDRIMRKIGQMKKESPITSFEAFGIKRDYFIYNTYIAHKSPRKRMEETYENVRKELAVADKAEELLGEEEYEAIDNLDWKSMRKIVSRMKNRIKQSFIDKSDGIANLLTAIETTKPAPYPEFVAARLVTHRHPPKK